MAVASGKSNSEPLTKLDAYVPLGRSGLRVSPICLVRYTPKKC